jgi:hypothetical protein
MEALLDLCPICGALTDPNAAFKAGGLLAWLKGSAMYLGVGSMSDIDRKIDAADLPGVIILLDYWKSHPLNPKMWFDYFHLKA